MSFARLARKMAEGGAPLETILLALEALEQAMQAAEQVRVSAEAARDAPRRAAREKKQRQRAKAANDNGFLFPVEVAKGDADGDGGGTRPGTSLLEERVSPEPLSETQTSHPPSPLTGAHGSTVVPIAKRTPFARFWEAYPSKVGKRAAELAFPKALKRAGTVEPMLVGLERSKRHWRDADAMIPHPTTWLNQDRWLDDYGGDATGPPTLFKMDDGEVAETIRKMRKIGGDG